VPCLSCPLLPPVGKAEEAVKELNAEGHAIMAAKDAKLKAIRTPELRLIKTINNDESGRSR
jgi:hypothetical protein